MCRCNRKSCNVCECRKLRKRTVREALALGTTVPYELRTLIEDGWSIDTVRRVLRPAAPSSSAAGGDHG